MMSSAASSSSPIGESVPRISALTARHLWAAIAAASLAHTTQMAFSLVPGHPASLAFVTSHFTVVVVVHLGLAFAFAGWREDRPWAAAVFAAPVAFALWPGAGGWIALLFALACLALAAWSPLGRGPGAPLVLGVFGAIVGVGLLGFLHRSYLGLSVLPGVTTSLAVAAVAAVVMIAGSRFVPAKVALPSSRGSLLTALIVWVAGALIGRVGFYTPRPVPPESVAANGAGGPPVVLIVLDTVRADHLELYGYHRDTMPNLERFAREEAVIVEQVRADGPSSLPSHASMFTGVHSPRHGGHKPFADDPDPPHYAYPLPDDVPTLAGILAEAGYWTVGISANFGPLDPAYGLGRGFHLYRAVKDETHVMKRRSPWRLAPADVSPLVPLDQFWPFAGCEFFQHGVPYLRAAAITDQAIETLDAAGDRPLFLFLNYFDAHDPYRPPHPFAHRFWGRSPNLPPYGISKEAVDEVMAGRRDLTDEERAHLLALYDGELAYLDMQLQRLLDRLKKHPRWDQMLVLISSDHGEGFGEHRILKHITLYAPLLRLPLIVKPGSRTPGAPRPGTSLPGPMQSVDMFATVLEHVGLETPMEIDGLPWGRGRTETIAFAYMSMSGARSHPHRFRTNLRAIERGGWKLIHSTTGEIELYQLADDPGERNNLADEHPEIRDALLAALDRIDWQDMPAERPRAHESEETLDKLRSLGYLE